MNAARTLWLRVIISLVIFVKRRPTRLPDNLGPYTQRINPRTGRRSENPRGTGVILVVVGVDIVELEPHIVVRIPVEAGGEAGLLPAIDRAGLGRKRFAGG